MNESVRIDRGHKPVSRLRKSVKLHWPMYLMLVVPVSYIIIFAYLPMGGIVMAFQNFRPTRGFMGSQWVGLKHFLKFWSMPVFPQLLKNTLTISLYSLIAGFPIPILLALTLNSIHNMALKKTVQMVTYAPYFISLVVMVGMLMQFLSMQIGPVNLIIKLMGGDAVNFMGEPGMFRSIYVWSGVWQGSGYGSIIYLAAISGVDVQQHEAAIIDGANKVQRVIHVDIPAILPTIVISLIMSCGSIMSVGHEKIFLMQNSLNNSVSEVISTYVYKVGLKDAQYSFAAAVGLFNSAVNFALLIIVNGIARKLNETSLW